jgi:signal transduction histidine kinase
MRVAPAAERRRVVECLGLRRSEILQLYQEGLVAAGNALAMRPNLLEECLRQANLILESLVAELTRRRDIVDSSDVGLSRAIGRARAAANIHPTESLDASTIFFAAVVTIFDEEVAEGRMSSRAALDATWHLQREIMRRIRQASVAYAGFLLAKVQEAQQFERRRIARDLHDRVGAGLSAAHVGLERYWDQQDRQAAASGQVQAVHQAVRECMEELRRVTGGLRSASAAGANRTLETALRRFLSERRSAVLVELDVNGDETWIPPDVADELFLVVREAMRNALTHAGAESVSVRVDIAPHELRAQIVDDGVGFEQEERGGGSGLLAMHERVALLDGKMVILTGRGRGTSIELMIPLSGLGVLDGADEPD